MVATGKANATEDFQHYSYVSESHLKINPTAISVEVTIQFKDRRLTTEGHNFICQSTIQDIVYSPYPVKLKIPGISHFYILSVIA